MPHIKRAIISVHDKSGIVEFARGLHKLGIEILSTGGTAKALRDNNIPVTEISDYTGSPEILDGRLKTLHPKIHGGILGVRSDSKHKKEMKDNGIEPIDMVVVNLYPFEATTASIDCKLDEAIENIDIGGPTMLRAAAKNWQDVAVVTDLADYGAILNELKSSGGEISKETCFKLAQKVFALTARYEASICNYLNSIFLDARLQSGEIAPASATTSRRTKKKAGHLVFPSTLALTFNKVQDLRYGENPHQHGAFYRESPSPLVGEGWGEGGTCITNARQLHGKELSYNNIMDADAALELAKEFADKTAAVIIKHTNPCGVAVSDVIASPNGEAIPRGLLAEAFIKARNCDPTSAFGGIVALTREVDAETAKAIGDTFFEVIIAPGFDKGALEILKAKKNLRLLELSGCPTSVGEIESQLTRLKHAPSEIEGSGVHFRKVSGGLLVQDADNAMEDVCSCKVVTKRAPTEDEFSALDFSWRVVKHVKSNAIVISSCERRATPASQSSSGGNDELRVLGIGAGQTSRVDSVKIAIMKSPPFVKGGKGGFEVRAMSSDAFFPFRDSIDLAAKAGITAIIQPGGSIRDEECIKAADEHNIAMIFTGVRHFRH